MYSRTIRISGGSWVEVGSDGNGFETLNGNERFFSCFIEKSGSVANITKLKALA